MTEDAKPVKSDKAKCSHCSRDILLRQEIGTISCSNADQEPFPCQRPGPDTYCVECDKAVWACPNCWLKLTGEDIRNVKPNAGPPHDNAPDLSPERTKELEKAMFGAVMDGFDKAKEDGIDGIESLEADIVQRFEAADFVIGELRTEMIENTIHIELSFRDPSWPTGMFRDLKADIGPTFMH
jgi:hypothetical protein